MNTVLNIIVNPVKAFNQLKTEVKFPVIALVILLMLELIVLILNVPVNAKISETVLSGISMPEKQMDMAIQMTHKLRYLIMLWGFIVYAGILFLHALLLFVIAWIFKTQLTYAKALRLIIYCMIISIIGALVNTAFLYFRGIDNINSVYDIQRIGANIFTSVEKAGAPLYVFLSSINPFEIWYIILLVIGVKIFTDSDWTKSLLICLIFWLIVTLYPVVTTYFSQMAMASRGIHI
jgi:hypothetical protein